MQVKKFILYIIVMVVLIVLSLPVSFAVNNIPTVYAEMPEPVPDEYNKYIICNDILYHFSFHIESVYTVLNPTNSQWYQQNLTAYETYSQESNGTYFDPTESMQGHLSQNGSVFDFVNVDIYNAPIVDGVQAGKYEPIVIGTDGSGTITYKDSELALTKVGQTFISDTYYLQLYVYDHNNFFIRVYPNDKLNDPVIVTASYCLSLFALDTGEMLRSEYQTITDTTLALKQWRVPIYTLYQDGISDYSTIQTIKSYGFVVANPNNTDYDIPQVVWDLPTNWDSYFLNTMLYVEEIWRNMVDVTSPVEPDTYSKWGNELNEYESNYSNISAEQVNIVLNNALGNGRYDNAASQIKAWINNFSIGELIAVCVFALALGTVTLTLGKKKSD